MYPQSPFLRNPLVESQIFIRNPSILSEILSWLCQTPKITTYRVNLLQTTTNAFKLYVNKVLHDKYKNPPKVFGIPQLPEVVCIENLNESTNLNARLNEIIVDSCCGSALLRGAHLYAPGVIGMLSGTQLNQEVFVVADLSGECKKGTCIPFASADNLLIGAGVVRMQRYQIYTKNNKTDGIAVEMKNNISGVPTIGDLSSNEALLQNLPSIICVRVLNPQPNELILDMCAAPGNKTTHIAEMMKDQGIIIAFDKTSVKINTINAKCQQNNLKHIHTYVFDGTKSYSKTSLQNNENLTPPYCANTFDRILLDAPCSALGNRPVLSSKMSIKMLNSYPKLQRQLFNNAVHLLKSNGTLVYSTCTITEAENELMIAWALNEFPQLRLIPAEPYFGGAGLPNLGLNDKQREMVQRFGPSNMNRDQTIDTVGFFIAKFQKI